MQDLHSVDWGAIGTNFGIFAAAAGALLTGIWQGVKKLSKTDASSTTQTTATGELKVASAMLVESTTMLMWSESNRTVCEAVHDLKDGIADLRDEMRELRHAMELDRATRGK